MFYVLLGALDLLITLAKGFVFSELWGFFAVPMGFFSIGFAHSIGLIVMFDLLIPVKTVKHSDKDISKIDIKQTFINKFSLVASCYICGLLLHSVM